MYIHTIRTCTQDAMASERTVARFQPWGAMGRPSTAERLIDAPLSLSCDKKTRSVRVGCRSRSRNAEWSALVDREQICIPTPHLPLCGPRMTVSAVSFCYLLYTSRKNRENWWASRPAILCNVCSWGRYSAGVGGNAAEIEKNSLELKVVANKHTHACQERYFWAFW